MPVRKTVNDRFACGTSESHFRNRVGCCQWLTTRNRPSKMARGNDPVPERSPYGGFPERDRAGVDYFGQTSTFNSRSAIKLWYSRASFFPLKDLATAPTTISASCRRLFVFESCTLTFLIEHLPESSFRRGVNRALILMGRENSWIVHKAAQTRK